MDKTAYAKFDKNGELTFLVDVPYVSNPTPSIVKKYAEKNGYKFVVKNDAPHQYCTLSYVDDGDVIRQHWVLMDLDSVKNMFMENVQQELNMKLSQRVNIPCELGFEIVYDMDACLNALGMMAYGFWQSFIDANNQAHDLDATGISKVAQALSSYRSSLYAEAQKKRTAIQTATSIDELLEIA